MGKNVSTSVQEEELVTSIMNGGIFQNKMEMILFFTRRNNINAKPVV